MPAADTERSLGTLAAEVKEEIKDFVRTRVQMLRFELRDKARVWKIALPMALCGLALLGYGLARIYRGPGGAPCCGVLSQPVRLLFCITHCERGLWAGRRDVCGTGLSFREGPKNGPGAHGESAQRGCGVAARRGQGAI